MVTGAEEKIHVMFNVHALDFWQQLKHQVILTGLLHTVVMGLQEEGGFHPFHENLALAQTQYGRFITCCLDSRSEASASAQA